MKVYGSNSSPSRFKMTNILFRQTDPPVFFSTRASAGLTAVPQHGPAKLCWIQLHAHILSLLFGAMGGGGGGDGGGVILIYLSYISHRCAVITQTTTQEYP